MKKCATCGAVHNEPTKDKQENELGIWFNCYCGSTLLIRNPNYEIPKNRLSSDGSGQEGS